ncbi:hypothetical protein LXL04_030657 [Taraxacum kok-saghyz]
MGNLFCLVQVDQSTVAIKETFGKFADVLEPGLHCVPWIFGSQVAGQLTLRLQQLDVKCETKTKDNVFVNVVASIQYRALADKASDAFYKLSNTRSQIQAYVFDVIRASVPKLNLDDAFEQKNEIAKAVEEELEKAMSAYGFEIVQTLIVDIEPDEHVKRAMNEINAAARLRMAATEKAEAEKILQIKRAEGEAESKYLSGLGIARQRQAIVDGLRDSVLGFSVNVPGTTAKDVMDMVLVTQYFDTMKEIGASSKSSAVFIPHGPGAVRDVASQIRDGLLQGNMGSRLEANYGWLLQSFEEEAVLVSIGLDDIKLGCSAGWMEVGIMKCSFKSLLVQLIRTKIMGNLLCMAQVKQSTLAIKETFGKFDEVLEPGCHCVPWIFGSGIAGKLSLRVQHLNVKCETKTKDNFIVGVVSSIQYHVVVEKASDAFYKLDNPRPQIEACVFDVISATVPKYNLADVSEQKNAIAKVVEEELETAMSTYGYEIIQALIVVVEPDECLKRAMNAEAEKILQIKRAEGQAEAEKILQIKRAEGEAESKYLSGLGIARQRQAIVDGLRDSVLEFSVDVPGTTAKDAMDMVLVTQYFDTMKEISACLKPSAMSIPLDPGVVRDVATQIREGFRGMLPQTIAMGLRPRIDRLIHLLEAY